jgi:ABC-type nitrate/sulfonate/bicarbonate transport system permease component
MSEQPKEPEKPDEPKEAEKPEAAGTPPAKPPHWLFTLRASPPAWISYALGAGCLLLIAVLWQLFGGEPNTQRGYILPQPGEVIGSYDKLVTPPLDLYDAIWVSFRRVIIGFAWAAGVGVLLGIVAASFRAVGAFVAPLATFMRSLPMAAVVPLTVVWFGIDEKQKQMFIFLAAVPFVFSDTFKAISSVPQRYVETAETLGASRFQIIRKVLVPLALPDIITGLRFLFGLALGYIMLAEAINPKAGLGYLINVASTRGSMGPEPVYLLLLVIGLIAFLIEFGARFLQRGIFHYRKDL